MCHQKVCIVTDASANIPKELKKSYNITVIPVPVFLGMEVFKIHDENHKLPPNKFYKKLSDLDEPPATSQPPSGDFIKTYKQLLTQKQVKNLISIHLSEKLSGLYYHALRISKMFGGKLGIKKVKIFDSSTVGIGLGNLIIEAAQMAEKGRYPWRIIHRCRKLRKKVNCLYFMDSLNFLTQTGRIGSAVSLGKTIKKENEKAIIRINRGIVHPVGVINSSWEGILKKLIDEISNQLIRKRILLSYTLGKEKLGKRIYNYIKEKDPKLTVHLIKSNVAINTHLGSKCFGISWFGKFKESWLDL
ncbi:MAG: DegV family EDD domain-containing protein [Candidatus Heimdallarchaeota archaeon]|nr:DegV family EDD domain-containing protein [Candidatus Heimdallarchaeota archaeon]